MDQLKTNLLEFLNVLFPDLFNGFIEIRAFHKETHAVKSIFCQSIKELMAQQATLLSAEYSIYFGVCPRKEKIGNKGAVNYLWTLWVDLDAKDFPGGKNDILARIKSFPISPTIVVDSGNGFHVYWRLKEALEIKSSEHVFKIETYLKRLAYVLGADSAAAEIARILRLPGTLNQKDPQLPKIVNILAIHPDQQCNLGDFDSIINTFSPDLEKSKSPGWIADDLLNLREGNRNETFAKIIGRLNRDGWGPADIFSLLNPHAQAKAFPSEELEREIKGICSRYPNNNSSLFSPHSIGQIEKEPKPFVVVHLSDFLSGTDEKIDWIVNGIFPEESVGILAGPAGYGKSWMLLDLAIECARGGKWMGRFQSSLGPVLYIDEESNASLLKRRLRKLLRGKGIENESISIHLIVGQGLCLNDKSSVMQLREQIKLIKPRIIIIDSLIRVHRSDENSASDMSKVFAVVKDLVREFKCTFLFADHQRKPNQFSGGMDQLLRGSTEKAAFVDTLLSLRRKEKLLIVEHSKSRFAEATPGFIIDIKDPSEDSTTVSFVGEAEAQVQEARLQTVGDFLRATLQTGYWVARKELVEEAKKVQISEKMLDETLKNFVASNLIERDDRKPYAGPGGKAAHFRWVQKDSSLFPSAETEIEMDKGGTV